MALRFTETDEKSQALWTRLRQIGEELARDPSYMHGPYFAKLLRERVRGPLDSLGSGDFKPTAVEGVVRHALHELDGVIEPLSVVGARTLLPLEEIIGRGVFVVEAAAERAKADRLERFVLAALAGGRNDEVAVSIARDTIKRLDGARRAAT